MSIDPAAFDSGMKTLQRNLPYQFSDPDLLKQALTHRSVGAKNYERLEFLGDGALNFVIASDLFNRFDEHPEGDLSRLRAELVNRRTLAAVARELDLGECLNLGPGELKSGGFRRDSILADALEGVLGAIYLDGGFDAVVQVVHLLFQERLENLPPVDLLKDPKTRLQELLQSRQASLPVYDLLETTGADHARVFRVSCLVEGLPEVVVGIGRSRRKAEQSAASQALEFLTTAHD